MKDMDMNKDIIRAYRNYPDRVAFVIDDTSYTYQEVFARVQGIMPFVQDCPEDIIGIIAEDCSETYASILAVLLSEKTYVILHPNYPDSRNRTIVESTGMKHVLYGHESCTRQGLPNEIKCISTLELRDENIDHLTREQTQDTNKNAYIIFTSGSTGLPKGVPISRKTLNAFYTAYHQLGWQLGPTDRMLQMFELTFDVSVVSTLYTITIGASVYTVGTSKLKYMRVYELMEDEELTFVAMPPSLLQFLSPYFGEIHVPKLKYLIVTAEAANADLLQRFRACAPQRGIRKPVWSHGSHRLFSGIPDSDRRLQATQRDDRHRPPFHRDQHQEHGREGNSRTYRGTRRIMGKRGASQARLLARRGKVSTSIRPVQRERVL